MDYTGIINLALVTLFFSTILAPGLKKIGDIKDEIASVDFPIIGKNDTSPEGSRLIMEKGVELTKKLTQYEDKYNETKRFMRYFYVILAIIVAAQLIAMYIQHILWGVSGILFCGSLAVVMLVIRLVRSYMTDPSIVRSIQWLAEKGISSAHTDLLFKPKIILNGRLSNLESNDDKTSIAIRSSADLNGYGYLLTIESVNYEKLYAVSAGFINNRQAKTTIAFPTGESGSESKLFNLKLNPGHYKVRLLFVSQVFGGNYPPGETVFDFEVPKKGEAPSRAVTIRLRSNTCGYIFTVKNKQNKQKIIHMESSENFNGSNNIAFIFSSAKLLNYLSKGYRPIVFYSRNGDIDRYDLDKYLTFYRVWKRRLYKRFKRPLKAFKQSKGPLILLNRNPKSKLETRQELSPSS